MGFVGSYVWRLRQVWGQQPLKVTGVAAFIVNHDGKVLLGKRSVSNDWGFIGGSVELEDSVTTTLKKEVREETGIEVGEYHFVGVLSEPKHTTLVYPGGDVAVVVNVLFEVPVGDAQPVMDEEHTEFGWFDLNALPQPFQTSGQSAMNAYIEFRRTGKMTIE